MAEYDPIDQAERERDRKDAKARERLAKDRDDADLKWLMTTERGRRIMWRLLEKAGVDRSSFNTNALQMAFNEGFRSYGQWALVRMFEVCPEMYPEMLKEQKADERNTSGSGPKSN